MIDRIAAYFQMFQGLFPPGQAWLIEKGSKMAAIVSVMAAEFSKVHARSDDLLRESDPRTALETLPEWETDYGLPDTCTGSEDTIQERRNALLNKINAQGGQSLGYFLGMAAMLGYDIRIEEFRPMVCGMARCSLGNPAEGQIITRYGITDQTDIRFNWRVSVLEPRVTWFRAGVSRAGKDHLAEISYAADLECLFNNLNPAHANLIFSYSGD